MLPRMSSTLGFQVPKRLPNADKSNLTGHQLHVLLWKNHCTAPLHLSHMAGKMLMHIK